MKNTKYVEDLKNTSVAELNAQLVEAKKELFNLRFQNATNQLDNTARIREVRRNIARIQTVITEAEKNAKLVLDLNYLKGEQRRGKKLKKNTYRCCCKRQDG